MGVCTQILCITDHFSTLHLTSVVNTHNLKKNMSRDVLLFLLTQLYTTVCPTDGTSKQYCCSRLIPSTFRGVE